MGAKQSRATELVPTTTSTTESVPTTTSTTDDIDLRYSAATKVSSTHIKFVLNADASGAYYLDFNKYCFVFVDFQTENETILASDGFKKIQDQTRWTNFVAIPSEYADETRFLASIKEIKSGKLFIVLFSASHLLRKVAICDEHWTGFARKEDFYHELHKSSNGDIYSIAYWWTDEDSKTGMFVCRLLQTAQANISVKTVLDLVVDGDCDSPFFKDNAIYFLLRKGGNILKLPLDGSFKTAIIPTVCTCSKCKRQQGHQFGSSVFSYAVQLNGSVFILVNDGKNAALWSFTIKNDEQLTSLSKYHMKFEHKIHGKEITRSHLQILEDGSAFIFIEGGTHIFQANLSVSESYQMSKELLGKGTYGAVVKGSLEEHGDVAIKIMNRPFAVAASIQKEYVLSAVTEARRLMSMSHKNVVKAFGYKIEESRFLLFMELMVESVRDKILRSNGKKLDEKESFAILQQALEGLVHLHKLKPEPIVHRDIKCANLLISRRGIIKLGDFGLIKNLALNPFGSTDRMHAPNEVIGTVYWQAPEVLISSVSYGRKADVWSMGCSLIEMLTGYPPYCFIEPSEWKKMASNATLSYNPHELLPSSAVASIFLLEKIFRRATKMKENQDEPQVIRPHSWEILADVKERIDFFNTQQQPLGTEIAQQSVEALNIVDHFDELNTDANTVYSNYQTAR